MGRVRIVWGSGRGPTALSSYDAALAAANVHDYNIVHISSVLPAETRVDLVGTAPDLGPVGERLTVVEARETTRLRSHKATETSPGVGTHETDPDHGPADVERERGHEPICAGLGWAQTDEGRGILYEGTGTDLDTVCHRIDEGLRAGCALRDLSPTHSDRVVLTTDGTTTRIERGTETADRAECAHDPVTARGPDGEHAGDSDEHATVVVLAAYGESDPIL